jgi:hypothetical protein
MRGPIPIKAAFQTVSEELGDGVSQRLVGEPGELEDHVDSEIAARYGIPFPELIETVVSEIPNCMALLLRASPAHVFATVQLAAFVAGVRWESGRHVSAAPDTAKRAEIIERLRDYAASRPIAPGEASILTEAADLLGGES